MLADPAEQQLLVLSQAPEDASLLNPDQVAKALERVGLTGRVVERTRWQQLDGVMAIPWSSTEA